MVFVQSITRNLKNAVQFLYILRCPLDMQFLHILSAAILAWWSRNRPPTVTSGAAGISKVPKQAAVGAGTKQKPRSRGQKDKCETCETKGKPEKSIRRNLQWWCASCLAPDFIRLFKCCHKKDCQNTKEFGLDFIHSNWRCLDCRATKNCKLYSPAVVVAFAKYLKCWTTSIKALL